MIHFPKVPPYNASHLPAPPSFRSHSPILRFSKSLLTKRYCRILFAALLSLSLLTFFIHLGPPSPSLRTVQNSVTQGDLVLLPPLYTQPPSNGLPPLFEAWKEYERNLPQHAQNDTTISFIYMKNHAWGSGWGNVLQEMLLNTHLAYLSGRSFVFDNYTWDRSPSEYSSFNGKQIPSRVPVSTMLGGPIIGGSFDPSYFSDPLLSPNQTHPRFVSSEYYERVCAGQKMIITTATVRDAVASWDGQANLEAWVKYLRSLPDRCIEFEIDAMHIFNIWMFGSTQILSLWPSLSQSPILRQFTHSPLILGAFERHRQLFGIYDQHISQRKPLFSLTPTLGSFLPDLFFSKGSPENVVLSPGSLVSLNDLPSIYPHSPATPNINDTIPGLLVLHIRRGDFAEHCVNLFEWGSSFNGFNSFDDLKERDGFDPVAAGAGTPPPGAEPVQPEDELEFAASLDGMSAEEQAEARRVYTHSFNTYASAKQDYDERKAKFETAKAHYLERCFPNIDQIVRHVRQIREDVALALEPTPSHRLQSHRLFPFLPPPFPPSAPLKHIYVMTNAKLPFLAELRSALENDAITNNPLNLPPWESIYSSRDLNLGWEEGYVAQALDMYIAQRAEVFIGNGFSSLTSNIILLRKANGVESVKTRLW